MNANNILNSKWATNFKSYTKTLIWQMHVLTIQGKRRIASEIKLHTWLYYKKYDIILKEVEKLYFYNLVWYILNHYTLKVYLIKRIHVSDVDPYYLRIFSLVCCRSCSLSFSDYHFSWTNASEKSNEPYSGRAFVRIYL